MLMPRSPQAQQPRFRKFEPTKQFKSTSLCMFIGRRGTGKTSMIKGLAHLINTQGCMGGETIDTAIVFSPTEGMQRSFEKFVPKCFVFEEYREDVVAALMETQKQLIKKNQHTRTVLIILDDVAYDKKFFTSPIFRELAMNGRHFKVCVMCAVQYCMDIPPSIRGNIDLTFAMKDNSSTNKKRLHSNLFSQFTEFRTFCKTYDQLTENHSAIVSLNNSNSNKLEETVFQFRVDQNAVPDMFRFGRSIFWELDAPWQAPDMDAAEERRFAPVGSRTVEPVFDATSVEFSKPDFVFEHPAALVSLAEAARRNLARGRDQCDDSEHDENEEHDEHGEHDENARRERRTGHERTTRAGRDRRRETSSIVRARQPTFPQVIEI